MSAVGDILRTLQHSEKLVGKRAHSWGSQDVRDVAQARYKAYGRYGHQDKTYR